MSALDQLVVQEALCLAGDTGAEDHVDDLEVGGEHGRLHRLEGHRLPRSGGAADSDQTGDAVAVLDRADRLEEGGLEAQAALGKGEILRVRHQVIGRGGIDDGVLIEEDIHDLFLVILFIEYAADIFALRHAAGAGGATRAGENGEVLEVDHPDLGAELFAGDEDFFEQDLTVAVLTSGGNAHDFITHTIAP